MPIRRAIDPAAASCHLSAGQGNAATRKQTDPPSSARDQRHAASFLGAAMPGNTVVQERVYDPAAPSDAKVVYRHENQQRSALGFSDAKRDAGILPARVAAVSAALVGGVSPPTAARWPHPLKKLLWDPALGEYTVTDVSGVAMVAAPKTMPDEAQRDAGARSASSGETSSRQKTPATETVTPPPPAVAAFSPRASTRDELLEQKSSWGSRFGVPMSQPLCMALSLVWVALILVGCRVLPGESTGVHVQRAYERTLVSAFLVPPDPNVESSEWQISRLLVLLDEHSRWQFTPGGEEGYRRASLLADAAFTTPGAQVDIINALNQVEDSERDKLYQLMLKDSEAIAALNTLGPDAYRETFGAVGKSLRQWAEQNAPSLAEGVIAPMAVPISVGDVVWVLWVSEEGKLLAAANKVPAYLYAHGYIPNQPAINQSRVRGRPSEWTRLGLMLERVQNYNEWHRMLFPSADHESLDGMLTENDVIALRTWHAHPVPSEA